MANDIDPFNNIITLTDSYKVSHHRQYPPGTQRVRSYFESRVGARYPFTKFFGLQYILKRYFVGERVTMEKIDEGQFEWDAHLGPGIFNRQGWIDMMHSYKGHLPLRICAVPEGLEVPIDNVLFTVVDTDDRFAWLSNYVETILTHNWSPSGVCTRDKIMKTAILKALEKSGDPGLISFKLHDFGFRGVSSVETAATAGAAHLVNFLGTDTFVACTMLRHYYGATSMPGFSIPAYEHSTVTSWGKGQGEIDCYRNALRQFPKGLLAVVSDSYDIYNACANIWGGVLKDEVLAREGTLVIRPDSGDPHLVLPMIFNILWEKFGGTINGKGYRVLDPHVRVIQGDGIDEYSLVTIMDAVMDAGYSIDNLAFGSGGGLLQKIDRDTQRNAFKCCEVTVNGEVREVLKTPKTDMTKASKAGDLKLIKENGIYRTVKRSYPGEDILIPVYDNGHLLVDHKLEDIRARE